MQKKNRIEWIDMAKGYGIILVLLGHLHIGRAGILWIYTFHLPLFFLLSGYTFRADLDFLPFFRKKSRSLLLPYFGLGIPVLAYMLFCDPIGGASKEKAIWLIRKFLVQNRFGTLWYLACLFCLEILFYTAVRVLKTDRKLLLLSIMLPILAIVYYLLGGKSLPWNVDGCFMAFPFFFGGYYYRNHGEKINQYLEHGTKKKQIFWILFVTNFLAGFLSVMLTGKGLEIYWCEFGFPPFVYLSAFAGIGWMIMLCKKKTFQMIRYIGENSILYFVWHQAIMIPESEKILNRISFFQGTNPIGLSALYIVLQIILILTVLTVCNQILMKTKLRIFLGKK